ncbi:hypothetical protein LIER_29837 [Lithospermum erythrorhizon]|uniref:Transposase n=1 Tax=Lithospermum erythrorhizon TaxID=34254 RepID=A0AAV3RNT5_LITER
MSYEGGMVEKFDYCDADIFEIGSVDSWAFRVGLRRGDFSLCVYQDPEIEGETDVRPLNEGEGDLEDENFDGDLDEDDVRIVNEEVHESEEDEVLDVEEDEDEVLDVEDVIYGKEHDYFDDWDLGVAEPNLTTAFSEQVGAEDVVHDDEGDSDANPNDATRVDNPTADTQTILRKFDKSVIDGDSQTDRQGKKNKYKGPYCDKVCDSDFDSGDDTSDTDREVDKKYGLMISPNMARRTREAALKAIQGDHIGQYDMVWDYIEELKRTHPGSTIFAEYEDSLDKPNTGMFKRVYVYLRPLVEGFKVGYRKLIRLDGCRTKGAYKQQILSAVALDPNNGWWPICWVVVENEIKET